MAITRREFSKTAIGASLALSLGGRISLAAKENMHRRPIPSSGEEIPIIGVGTNRYGVGDDAELRRPLKAALQTFHDLGGTVVDTAPSYRSSEIVLGELIGDLGISDELFMATKVDVGGRDESASRMQRSFERLGKDPMELMQVHDFKGWEDSIPVMQEWKEEGRIKYIGMTTSRQSQYEQMEPAMKRFDLDFIQVNYSLANQRASADRLLPMAADRGMAVLVNRPFGGGGVFKKLSGAAMPAWALEIDIESWAQLLLKYVLSHPSVSCAIPGMTKSRHVEDNLKAATGRLPDSGERRKMEAFFDSL